MINLLPQQQKEDFLRDKREKIISILGFLLLIFLVFIIVLFFSIKIYLTGETQEQKFLLENANILMSNPKYKELEEKITGANQSINQLNNFYKNQTDIVQALENISNVIPSGVSLVNFSYQKENPQVILQGKASTRDNLLFFKKSLEELKKINDFYSPVSNLIKSTDIDFYFSFNLVK